MMKLLGNKFAMAAVAGLVGLALTLAAWHWRRGGEPPAQTPSRPVAVPRAEVSELRLLPARTNATQGTNHGKIVLPPTTPEEYRAVMQDPEAREKWARSQEIARLLNSPASATPECRALLKIFFENGFPFDAYSTVYAKLYQLKAMEYSRTNASLTINGAFFDPANPEHVKGWQRMLDHAATMTRLELIMMKIPTNAVEAMLKIRPTVFYGNDGVVGEAAKKIYTDEDLRRLLAEPPATP